ncbi:MAG: DoxX family protein [Myxococcota bacterium]
MKIARTIAYWALTGLFSLSMIASGGMYLAGGMDDAVTHLGYPPSFIVLMGALKVLGGIALLIPALPRAKEWVYAGFVFNLIGASWSHAYIGDGIGETVTPLILGLFLVASYLLRPDSLWLGGSIWSSSAGSTHGEPVPAK